MSAEYILYSIIAALITFTCFKTSFWLFLRAKSPALLHPLITGSSLLLLLLFVADVSVDNYLKHTELLSALLAPATVALAVPLYNNLASLLKYKQQILLPLFVGALVSPAIALLLMWLAEANSSLMRSMISKSITSPIAIDITSMVGGMPAIAVIFVVISGIFGAVVATPLFNLIAIKSDISKGVALGVTSHAIGTSRAIQISEKCSAFATLAMCLNGLITTLVIVIYSYWI